MKWLENLLSIMALVLLIGAGSQEVNMPVLIFFGFLFAFGIIVALILGTHASQKKRLNSLKKSIPDELRMLNSLRDKGTISDEEFELYKHKLLTDDSYFDH